MVKRCCEVTGVGVSPRLNIGEFGEERGVAYLEVVEGEGNVLPVSNHSGHRRWVAFLCGGLERDEQRRM